MGALRSGRSLLGLVALCVIPSGALGVAPPFTEYFMEQPVDHFNAQVRGTYKHRYLVNDQWYNPDQNPPPPILFYTGNEGNVESFWNNTGFMIDTAPSWQALVVFAEHRYYGKSLPFGPDSWSRDHIGYLSVDQALADFASVVNHVKEQYNALDAPVVAFGGSYGGMLSAWFRIKYPHVVDMALAASAPIPMMSYPRNLHVNTDFWAAVTKDAADANPLCPDAVRTAFARVLEMADEGQNGYAALESSLKLCEGSIKGPRDIEHLILWAQNAWGTMGMVDYPYEADFLGPMPPFPINVACEYMTNHSHDPVAGLSLAVGLLYGNRATDASVRVTPAAPYPSSAHTPTFSSPPSSSSPPPPPQPSASSSSSTSSPSGGRVGVGGEAGWCRDMYEQYVFCADQSGCGTGNDGKSWDYQVCTDMVYALSSTNTSDMFPARTWTLDDLNDYCMKTWGVKPQPALVKEHFGGADIAGSATRIIFSNGLLDPWHTGGFLSSLSPSLPAVIIPSGAHHIDLRSANEGDPQDVDDAREAELSYLKQWLEEVYTEKGFR